MADPLHVQTKVEREPQRVATLGLQVKTIPTCKICNSPHRGEIEDFLVLRQRGENLRDGTRPTERWFLENSAKRWGMPLNKANIHTHFSKHFKVGSPAELKKNTQLDVRTQLLDVLEREGVQAVAPEVFLEAIVAIAHKRVMADPAAVTVDQGMKAVAELTKRKHDEQTANLMAGLTGAVQAVAQAAGAKQPDVITVTDVEELADGDSADAPVEDSRGEVWSGEGDGGDEPVGSRSLPPGELSGDQES